PVVAADNIQMVAAARKAGSHAVAELLVTEWNVSLLGTKLDATKMDVALHHAELLTLAASAGVTHAHHALFSGYLGPGLPGLGLINHDFSPKPSYHAFSLLAQVIRDGAARLSPPESPDGKLDNGMGSVLASKDAAGKIRVLFVNRGDAARTASVGA